MSDVKTVFGKLVSVLVSVSVSVSAPWNASFNHYRRQYLVTVSSVEMFNEK